MKSHLTEPTIDSYRLAVVEGRARPPLINSVWFDPKRDDYFALGELASLALRLYFEKRARPWVLRYALEFGTESERHIARTIFYEMKVERLLEDEYLLEDWFYLAAYFTSMDPSICRVFPYRKGGILGELSYEEDWQIWLLGRDSDALRDMERAVDDALTQRTTNPNALYRVCKILEPLGRRAFDLVSTERLGYVGEALFESWKSLRFIPKEDEFMTPLDLSWDRLHWCWCFGLESQLNQLCDEPVFLSDCFSPPNFPVGIGRQHGGWAQEIAGNILALSLTSSADILNELPSNTDIIERQTDVVLNYFRENDPDHEGLISGALTRFLWNETFPLETTTPDEPELEKHYFPSGDHPSEGMTSMLHDFCGRLWRLRLAIAIVDQRSGKMNSTRQP